jgi:hypothetical protein
MGEDTGHATTMISTQNEVSVVRGHASTVMWRHTFLFRFGPDGFGPFPHSPNPGPDLWSGSPISPNSGPDLWSGSAKVRFEPWFRTEL